MLDDGLMPASDHDRELPRMCCGTPPFAPMWWVAVAWLVIAALAHLAAAIPLVLVSLFVLGVACRNKPVPGFGTRRNPGQ